MPYTLYTDKNENFECEVAVKNASLKGSMARLVVESSDGLNLIFNGKIENGKCNIPIRRLKGILDENTKGNMFLEVVVEDTYFKPWESEFTIQEHTSVKVTVNEQKQPSNKPIVEVKIPTSSKQPVNKKKGINIWVPLSEITNICKKFGIRKSNLNNKKREFHQIIKEYFNANPEFKNNKSVILSGLKHFLK